MQAFWGLSAWSLISEFEATAAHCILYVWFLLLWLWTNFSPGWRKCASIFPTSSHCDVTWVQDIMVLHVQCTDFGFGDLRYCKLIAGLSFSKCELDITSSMHSLCVFGDLWEYYDWVALEHDHWKLFMSSMHELIVVRWLLWRLGLGCTERDAWRLLVF